MKNNRDSMRFELSKILLNKPEKSYIVNNNLRSFNFDVEFRWSREKRDEIIMLEI